MLMTACNERNDNERVTAVEMSETQTVNIDAVNYEMSYIEGVPKISDSGIIYAFCTDAEGANATVSNLNSLLGTELQKYNDEDKNLILILVTLGEGEKSDYSIEKIEMVV